MKRSLPFLTGLGSLLLLGITTGCQSPHKTVTVTAAQSGSTVHLNTGDLLLVEVKSQSPGKSSWETLSINSWVVARIDPPEFQPHHESSRRPASTSGDTGTLLLDYRAVGPGSSLLKLGEIQSWQGHSNPAQTLELNVVVK